MPRQVKRDPSSVIMPDDENIGKKARKKTEERSNNTVNITEDTKAKKITYSLNPKVIAAINRYAKDSFMSKSQVVTQAVRNMIPPEYFE